MTRQGKMVVGLAVFLVVTAAAETTPPLTEWGTALRPTRELTVVPDSVVAWWTKAATCLTGDTAWRGTRVFVGYHAPKGWDQLDDPFGAVNPSLNAIWVRRLDAPTITHEMAHMRLWPAGTHPGFAFPLYAAPLCGLAPTGGT
jgi:hypothetical protein